MRARVQAHLETLKMSAAQDELPGLLERAMKEGLDAETVVHHLLDAEVRDRRERRIAERLKKSGLPEPRRSLEEYEWDFPTSIDRARIMALSRLDFIAERQNVIITGPSGTGKSHLGQALAFLACGHDYRVLYSTCAGMLRDLYASLAGDDFEPRLKRYANPTLLVIDDLGTEKVEIVNAQGASLFFKVINMRYGKASTIITSNLDTKKWEEHFGDPNVTVAALDRFTHHAIPVPIEGPSYRTYSMEERMKAQVQAQAAEAQSQAAAKGGKPRRK